LAKPIRRFFYVYRLNPPMRHQLADTVSDESDAR
jgi:hypothetical protein